MRRGWHSAANLGCCLKSVRSRDMTKRSGKSSMNLARIGWDRIVAGDRLGWAPRVVEGLAIWLVQMEEPDGE